MSRSYTLASGTDLQRRLGYINERAKELEKKSEEGSDVNQLAYMVAYLSAILHKHLSTKEV